MADQLDTIGNFSIQDTMDMGAGNTTLINDFLETDTTSADPEKVEAIVKEVDATEAPASPAVKGKEVVPPKNAGGDSLTEGQSLISNFLGDNDEEEEEEPENEVPASKSKSVADTDESDDSSDDEHNTGSKFSALATDLFKLGVFSKEEDEEDVSINTPEEFLERFQSEKKKGATEIVENFIGQFGEDYQQAFEAIYVKGVNPKDYFTTYNNIVNFAELDLTEEDNQVKIMKQTLADQGFDPEDITTEIDRLKNYGDLETVAAKHHKVLVKKESAKLQQLETKAEQDLQHKAQVKNQYVQNVQNILQEKMKTKEFDGIPLNPKLATELQDFLLVDKWKTPSGETLTDFDRAILDMKRPENHAMKVKMGLLLKILEKDPTLSTIQKTGVSKKTDELFGEVARQVTKTGSSKSSSASKDSNKWFL